MDISDPDSVNYGMHMTKDEVYTMTSNPTANIEIKAYLSSKGAEITSETIGR